jgi:hypothetical protein
MGNYQVRFWRAVEGATSSLTLLIKALGACINRPGGSGLSCKLNAETTYIQLNLFESLGLLKTPTSA